MSELAQKLNELKKLYEIDKKFVPAMQILKDQNQINFDRVEYATDSISRCLNKKLYLLELAKGFQIEAEFIENGAKIFELIEELFQEGGLLDQLNQSETK
jgi:hypothetical protein